MSSLLLATVGIYISLEGEVREALITVNSNEEEEENALGKEGRRAPVRSFNACVRMCENKSLLCFSYD